MFDLTAVKAFAAPAGPVIVTTVGQAQCAVMLGCRPRAGVGQEVPRFVRKTESVLTSCHSMSWRTGFVDAEDFFSVYRTWPGPSRFRYQRADAR